MTIKQIKSSRKALEVAPEALELIAKRGFDPVYGARPLRRRIQTEIEDAAAGLLLDGRLAAGGKLIVRAGKDGLEVTAAE